MSALGHRADLREVMAASNLVLYLSKVAEAFGRTTLEALSLGVPVIGYDHGGVHEILTRVFPEGRTPAGDLPALVAKTLDPHFRAIARAGTAGSVTLLTKRRSQADRLLAAAEVGEVLWLERNPGRHDGVLGILRLAHELQAHRFTEAFALHGRRR